MGLTHPGTLPHSLMSLQRGGALLGRRTQRQILTWRGGSHWLLAVTGEIDVDLLASLTGEKSRWCDRFLPRMNGYLFKLGNEVLAETLEKFTTYVKGLVAQAIFTCN